MQFQFTPCVRKVIINQKSSFRVFLVFLYSVNRMVVLVVNLLQKYLTVKSQKTVSLNYFLKNAHSIDVLSSFEYVHVKRTNLNQFTEFNQLNKFTFWVYFVCICVKWLARQFAYMLLYRFLHRLQNKTVPTNICSENFRKTTKKVNVSNMYNVHFFGLKIMLKYSNAPND